jgi:hypothetical protein
MNVSVRTVTLWSTGATARAGSGSAPGALRLVHGGVHQHHAGELIACRSAQPSEIGPPQSWATVTTGP